MMELPLQSLFTGRERKDSFILAIKPLQDGFRVGGQTS